MKHKLDKKKNKNDDIKIKTIIITPRQCFFLHLMNIKTNRTIEVNLELIYSDFYDSGRRHFKIS